MSILLDALKKSEEQRRIGQAPDIHSAAAGLSGRGSGTPRWIPAAMVTASVILMAGIGWLQLRAPEDLQSAAAPEISARQTGDAADKSLADGRKNSAKPGRTRSLAAVPNRNRTRTPVETFSGSGKAAPGASPASDKSASDPRTQVNRSFRTFQAAPAQHSASASTQQTPATAAGSGPESAPGPGPGPATSREVASETPPESPAAAVALEPISYWQLPQSVRDDLPELKITVLVFADKPEDRFLLVNGQRLVEKDEIPGGVVLDEIRRDGAVFQYRKYRFLVKG